MIMFSLTNSMHSPHEISILEFSFSSCHIDFRICVICLAESRVSRISLDHNRLELLILRGVWSALAFKRSQLEQGKMIARLSTCLKLPNLNVSTDNLPRKFHAGVYYGTNTFNFKFTHIAAKPRVIY
jgi:hypothetical protein